MNIRMRAEEELKLSSEQKLEILLKEGKESGGIGLDFGEKILFACSDGNMIQDLTSEELIKLASTLSKSYFYVSLEDLHPNSLYSDLHHSKEQVDKFLLFKETLFLNNRLITVPKHNTSKRCSFCRKLKKKPLRGRIFICDFCDFKINRDMNASLNIRFDGYGWYIYPLLGALPSGKQKFKFVPGKMKQRICIEDRCTELTIGNQDVCQFHYNVKQKAKWRAKNQGICKLEDCDKKIHRNELCWTDYNSDVEASNLTKGIICAIMDCDRGVCLYNWCYTDYRRLQRAGLLSPLEKLPKPTVCKFEGCDNPSRKQGADLCNSHYNKDLKRRKIERGEICSVEDCINAILCANQDGDLVCGSHYHDKKWYEGEAVDGERGCKVDGCKTRHNAYDFCKPHYTSAVRYGVDEYGMPELD